MDKPLSQTEAYKVADWLKSKGKEVGAVLRTIWRKSPSEIAQKFNVKQGDVVLAAGRQKEGVR